MNGFRRINGSAFRTFTHIAPVGITTDTILAIRAVDVNCSGITPLTATHQCKCTRILVPTLKVESTDNRRISLG